MTYHRISFSLEALENRRASSLGRKMKNMLWTGRR
jgi:hypothetical protein